LVFHANVDADISARANISAANSSALVVTSPTVQRASHQHKSHLPIDLKSFTGSRNSRGKAVALLTVVARSKAAEDRLEEAI
jgi:hypothetical protein